MPLQDKNGSPLNYWDKGFLSQNTPCVTDALGLSKFPFYAG